MRDSRKRAVLLKLADASSDAQAYRNYWARRPGAAGTAEGDGIGAGSFVNKGLGIVGHGIADAASRALGPAGARMAQEVGTTLGDATALMGGSAAARVIGADLSGGARAATGFMRNEVRSAAR